MKADKLIAQLRVDHPKRFRIADVDPADSFGLDIEKDEAQTMLAEGVKAPRRPAGAALRAGSLGAAGDPAGRRHLRQGRRHRARDVGGEPAGLPDPFLQGAERGGARPRLPLAQHHAAAGARADRHLQPLLMQEVLVVRVHRDPGRREAAARAGHQEHLAASLQGHPRVRALLVA